MPGEIISIEEFNALNGSSPKKAAAVHRGKVSQAQGKAAELNLEITHQAYKADGLALIYQLPVPTAPMPRSWLRNPAQGGIGRILAKRQAADYYGTLKGGRSILMEAKSQSTRTLGLNIIAPGPKEGHGLKEIQLEGLVECHKMGGLAALVWCNGPERLVYDGKFLAQAWNQYRMGTVKRIEAVDGWAFNDRRVGGVLVGDWLGRLTRGSTPLSRVC